MPPTRPPYPSELAKEFEPTAQTIQNWIRQADRDEGLWSSAILMEYFGLDFKPVFD